MTSIVRPLVRNLVNDGVFDMTSYGGAGGVPLWLNLTNTASLEEWLTEYTGSYARSSAMGTFDFEGIYKESGNNIAPFYGARRVENLIGYNADISQANWSGSATITGTDGFQVTAAFQYVHDDVATLDAHEYVLSFVLSVGAGDQTTGLAFRHNNSETGENTLMPTVSTVPTRYSIKVLGREGGGNCAFGIRDQNGSNWAKVTITDFQVEDVTGQANQNPSDVIPTTTAAVTKYYTTTNGNTVSSNVVTEAAGTELENIIGLAFWPSTTNSIGSAVYRDFTHADWNATNGSITAGAVTLIDGTSVSDDNTFTASGANGTIILDPYTSASGVHAGGVFIKRKTGTGAIEVTVDGGSTWVAVTTQVAGDSGWHLCQTTLPTVTDPEIGVRLVTSGDAVYLDWAQLDDGEARVSSHPIPGGDTLAAQSLIAADATNAANLISDTKGAVYAEAMLLPDDLNLNYGSIAFTVGTIITGSANNNTTYSNDGTNNLIFPNSFVGYTKVASYWSGVIKQLSNNGSSSSVGDYDGSWGADALTVGGSGAYNWNGIISRVCFDPSPHDSTYWEGETT